MLNCSICYKNFENRKSLSNHLTGSYKNLSKLEKEKIIINSLYNENDINNCLNDYINEKYAFYNLPIDIRKYITLLGLKRTSKEERRTNRYKDKYISSIREKYGSDIINVSQNKEVKQKIKNTILNKYNSYEDYSKHIRKQMNDGLLKWKINKDNLNKSKSKYLATMISKYGVDNPSKILFVREINSIKQKEKMNKLSYEEKLKYTAKAREAVCNRGGYSSKIEKRVQKILIDLDITFITNKNLWNYNWDIIFDKFIIEVQGTMWHANPKIYKETDLIMGKLLARDIWEKDRKKRIKAESSGYCLIEIWEDDINRRTDEELLIFIKDKLNEFRY